MAQKKSSRQATTTRISGKDASVLSFVARHGKSSAAKIDMHKDVSPHVVKLISGKAGDNKNRKGYRTLTQLRRLAEQNSKLEKISALSRRIAASSNEDW